MQAYMHLQIKPLKTQEARHENGKKESRFPLLSKLMRKSVNYYDDEELKKLGMPYIWTE